MRLIRIASVLIAEDPAADELLKSPVPKPVLPTPAALTPPAAVTKSRGPSHAEWAIRGGSPNVQAAFERLRPSLAMTHPFELDTFQKEAVIHLEQVRGAHAGAPGSGDALQFFNVTRTTIELQAGGR